MLRKLKIVKILILQVRLAYCSSNFFDPSIYLRILFLNNESLRLHLVRDQVLRQHEKLVKINNYISVRTCLANTRELMAPNRPIPLMYSVFGFFLNPILLCFSHCQIF